MITKFIVISTTFCLTNSVPIDISLIKESGSDDVTMVPPLMLNLTNYANVSPNKSQYIGTIALGDPPQAFQMLIDTGSPVSTKKWLWVPSLTCNVMPSTTTFNTSSSQTYVSLSSNQTIDYGGAGCTGILSKDTLSIGSSNTQIQARDQIFVLAMEETNMTALQADGIMVIETQGLGLNDTTVIDSLYAQGQIPARKFGLFFSENKFTTDSTVPSSSLIIGGSNLTAYSHASEFAYANVQTPDSWSIPLSAISIGSQAVPSTVQTAVLDTGRNILIQYSPDYIQIINAISANGNCGVDKDSGYLLCDCIANYAIGDYPTLSFSLGDAQDNNFCVTMLQPTPEATWIIGTVLNRGYYMEFDLDQMRVGLAPAVNSINVPSGTTYTWWQIALIILMAFALFLVVVMAIKIWKDRNRRRRREFEPVPHD